AICRDPRDSDAGPGTRDAEWWRASHVWAAAASGEKASGGHEASSGDPNWPKAHEAAEAAKAAERSAHCAFLRDLFGEFFGPVGGEGCWMPLGPDGYDAEGNGPEQWCLVPAPLTPVVREEWLAWNGGIVRRLAEAIYEEQAFDRLPVLAD